MTSTQIQHLINQFSNQSLPKSEWTHEAHIVVAFWYNWYFEYEEALDIVRKSIITYNEAVGTENTDHSGYHETLTVFWMRWTRNFIAENDYKNIEQTINAFIKQGNGIRDLPFQFYSREVLFSVNARKNWVNGDLKEILLTSD